MGQLGIVVPFTVFTEYRDRRAGGRDSTAAKPDARRRDEDAEADTGRVDTTSTPAGTTVPAEPTTERIPS